MKVFERIKRLDVNMTVGIYWAILNEGLVSPWKDSFKSCWMSSWFQTVNLTLLNYYLRLALKF